ncbi:hypothetical protein CRH09_27540 [Nocardia terpenica]|uniref:Uncharacterized protein n=1 Tax=Nocardia terpenica TaxID=455432 RepID=A0A291RPW3_9NOCA|nr:hypothetical protein CRH09_27540 [Nocardia terpenica]
MTIEGPCDVDRLRTWLADLSPSVGVERATAGEILVHSAADVGARITVPTALACDPTWWAAATVRRMLRTVPDADSCGSPGLAGVLRDGEWFHPRVPDDGVVPANGVLLFKPGLLVGPEALTGLAERLAECGYIASRARMVGGADIGRENMAVDHYRPHIELARRGRLTPEERETFLRIYDRAEFVARFGVSAHEADIVPAYVLVDEYGVPAEHLQAWSEESTRLRGLNSGAVDGPNEIGDCLFVNVFQQSGVLGGRPAVVLNPHIPGVVRALERTENRVVSVLVAAYAEQALPWARMRREFCGTTDPSRALPGSLRGDAFAGLFPLRGADGTPVCRTNNGVHLSNGLVETLHDGRTWFGLRPEDTTTGRLLLTAGVSPELLGCSFVELARRRHAISAVTDGLEYSEVVRILRRAQPLPC